MMPPLGLDEETLKHKNERRKYWKQFSAWNKGYKAGKNGSSSGDNPYKLSSEIWSLLRKRTRWELGRQESAYTFSKKKRLKALKEQARLAKRIKAASKKHVKHKSKGHKKHRHRE